jgi:hypothetical protein
MADPTDILLSTVVPFVAANVALNLLMNSSVELTEKEARDGNA